MPESSEVYRRLIEEHRARARFAMTPSLERSFVKLADAYERLIAAVARDDAAALDRPDFVISRYVLGDLAARLEKPSSISERIGTILEAAIALHGADFGNIQALDIQSDTLKIVGQRNFEDEFLTIFAMVDATDGSVCGRALAAGAPVIVAEVDQEPSLEPYRAIFARAGVRAVQSTPIAAPTGRIVGMLSTHFRRVHTPSALDMTAAEICADLAGGVLAELYDRSPADGRIAT